MLLSGLFTITSHTRLLHKVIDLLHCCLSLLEAVMWRSQSTTHDITLCNEVQMLVHTIHDWCQCHKFTRPNYMNVSLIFPILTRRSEVRHDFMK